MVNKSDSLSDLLSTIGGDESSLWFSQFPDPHVKVTWGTTELCSIILSLKAISFLLISAPSAFNDLFCFPTYWWGCVYYPWDEKIFKLSLRHPFPQHPEVNYPQNQFFPSQSSLSCASERNFKKNLLFYYSTLMWYFFNKSLNHSS